MRRILTGLLAAVLALGFLAVGPAEAKVYKMKPEERAAALKEKKARKARKKAGKTNTAAPGGWVEVKPGSKPERKPRKSTQVAETVEKKGKKAAAKPTKKAEKTPEKKAEKKADKNAVKKADKKAATKGAKKAEKKSAKGDRLVGKSYTGEAKVRGTGIEVRRPGAKAPRAEALPEAAAAPAGDDLSGYSVKRPGQEKHPAPAVNPANPANPATPATPAVAPEVRQPVQPGPADAARPVGTEQKAGEGRF